MHTGNSPVRISEAITAGGDTDMFTVSGSSTIGMNLPTALPLLSNQLATSSIEWLTLYPTF